MENQISPDGNPEIILVWPQRRPIPSPTPIDGYSIQPLSPDKDHWWIDIQKAAVPHYRNADAQPWLDRYRSLALPDGILVAVEGSTQQPVATAGSLYSPRKELFANGGEIGWVATIPEHRGRGLGTWLCTLTTQRLLQSNVDTVFLTTGADMPAAIRVYLKLGYLPYLYEPSQQRRWEAICKEINYPIDLMRFAK